MRPIFCGNFEYDARQSELEKLFRRYGKVDRVDMKSGFAFVYMEDERDAEDAIRRLDQYEFGRKGRRLRVEWTKQERSVRKPVNSKRSSSNLRPSKTLFVINFDPYHTRTRDLERHFDPYGKILNIRIRRNFAFIQFESQEDASKALDATNMSKLMDRVISVEYAIKDDDERKSGYSPDRIRDKSPRRRSDDRGRSPSPYRRDRGSPDYGRGRGRSPSPYRRERASPDYGRGPSASPNGRERKSDYGHGGSGSPNGRERKSVYSHGGSRSPNGRERKTDYGRGAGSPNGRERKPDYGHGPSPSPPKGREKISDYGRGRSMSPRREMPSPDPVRGSSPRDVLTPEYDHGRSPSPRTERVSPDDYRREASPDSKPEPQDSPGYSGGESPIPDRYQSRSPLARERSRS